MLKPLSEKTLAKKYAELAISQDEIDLLHRYFLCFSNLYGVISLRDAWEVFRHYEGTSKVHKKDFIAFSDIVQREAGHPYGVYELKEIYSGEESDAAIDRRIVHNSLVTSGYYRFERVYATEDRQGNRPYYLPERETFLSFTEDRFYLTAEGRALKLFVENLKTDGISRDNNGEPNGELRTIDGLPAKRKRLADCIFYTKDELFEAELYKSEAKKRKLLEEFRIPASEKVLRRIESFIMTGGIFIDEDPAKELSFLADYLYEDLGVALLRRQLERLAELFVALNNRSNLWQNCGWSPEELSRRR